MPINIVMLAMRLMQNRDRLAKIKELFPGLDQEQPSETEQSDYPVGSVEWLQDSLNTLNDAALEVDGNYGEMTRQAVGDYQSEHPPLVVDGWCGVETTASIIEELAKV